LLLRTSTSIPGTGATSVRVTVPVTSFDPTMDETLRVNALRVMVAGCSVIVCDRLTPVESVPVTSTGVEEATGLVTTALCPLLVPA
jgi:hypothetical protein